MMCIFKIFRTCEKVIEEKCWSYSIIISLETYWSIASCTYDHVDNDWKWIFNSTVYASTILL